MILLEDNSAEADVFDTCYQIKNRLAVQHVQVIILSEREEEYLEAAAFNAGTNDYIIKPQARPQALIGRIKSLLRKDTASYSDLVQSNGHGTLRIDRDSFAVYI